MNAIHACSILSPSPGSFSFTGSPKDSPPIKKKKEKKKRKEKARDGRKLSMHIYHMNERVLVPTLPCILLLSTDYLSIVPRVLKPRKNKKGTKIRTKQFRSRQRGRNDFGEIAKSNIRIQSNIHERTRV